MSDNRRLRAGRLVVRPVLLAAAGDVTPGEGVSEAVDREGDAYPWTGVARVLRGADIATVNLEGVISDRGVPVAGKEYHFRGGPGLLRGAARVAGIDVVTSRTTTASTSVARRSSTRSPPHARRSPHGRRRCNDRPGAPARDPRGGRAAHRRARLLRRAPARLRRRPRLGGHRAAPTRTTIADRRRRRAPPRRPGRRLVPLGHRARAGAERPAAGARRRGARGRRLGRARRASARAPARHAAGTEARRVEPRQLRLPLGPPADEEHRRAGRHARRPRRDRLPARARDDPRLPARARRGGESELSELGRARPPSRRRTRRRGRGRRACT